MQVPPWLVGVAVGNDVSERPAGTPRFVDVRSVTVPHLHLRILSSDKIVAKGKHIEFNTDAYLQTADITTETLTGDTDE